MAAEREELTPGEVGKLVGVRRQMVYNYISAGRLPAHHDQDGRWKVYVGDAEAWLEARKAKAKAKRDEIKRQLRGEVT